MRKKSTMARRLAGPVLLAALEVFAAGALFAVATVPAGAQWGGFQQWFGGPSPRRQNSYGWPWQQQEPRREAPVDSSRAPPAHKRETPATTNVLVLGDSMADWLGFGLEDAFTETPEIGVIRKPRVNRGLIKTEGREAYDAVAAVREILAGEKPDYIVMITGLADRTSIRERPRPAAQTAPAAKQAPAQAHPQQQAAAPAEQQAPAPPPADAEAGSDEPAIVAPAPEPGPSGSMTHPFRSDKWADLYAKRIDETIAALKSKGVPVLWVGLPAIRGTRSTADMVYLNDLYRDRAGKAGIIYVDIWDGFVDENGNYVNQGPDFEGQIRRLRAGDGLHFTKAGARKLAHYVEREIRRVMLARGAPVAMPIPAEKETPQAPAKPGVPTRPVAGPVVPLTGPTAGSDGLLGGGPARTTSSDPVVNRVLVRGEPVAAPSGRADNFAWPRSESPPASTSLTEPPEPGAAASPPSASDATKAAAPPKQPAPVAPKRRAVQTTTPGQGGSFSRDDQPRPPGSVPRSNNGGGGGWWSGWGR